MTAETIVIPYDDLRTHWQGHRGLTRRIIAAFPEDALFTFSIGGMRPFGAMAIELIGMASAGVRALATREWTMLGDLEHHAGSAAKPDSRQAILDRWDATTAEIDAHWPRIPPQRFQEIDKAFGMYEGRVYDLFLYWVENEVHHRGQGYVYLRALGIEPAPFYDRG